MTPDAIQQEIARIIRDELLLGSERPLPLDAPLGELGLGLDSLALVHLLTAVEASFGVELPEDIWMARGPLSVKELAELVRSTPETALPAAPLDRTSLLLHGRMERLESSLRRRGRTGRAAWGAVRAAAPVKRFLFSNTRHLLLERRLDDLTTALLEPPPGIELRSLAPGEEDVLDGLWPPVHERRIRRSVERSLRGGATALVAREGDRVLAVDLLSPIGADEVDVVRPDACYGFHLTEKREARGRGIGLALVAYSLRVARELGFRVQLTDVWEGNVAMLASATQLLGFRMIGEARRTRVAGFTRWSWEVLGVSNRGRRLVL